MRQIKFRAWDKKEKKLRKVVRIDFDNELFFVQLRTPTDIAPKHWCLRNKEDVILEQFTGLTDKNGKEIYEGDNINCPDGEYEVVYSERFACFQFVGANSLEFYLLKYFKNPFEVIGNIHQ